VPALEVTLSVQELANKCLAGRHVAVVLDPSTTNEVKATFVDLRLDLVKEFGVKLVKKHQYRDSQRIQLNIKSYLLKPLILLCRARRKPMLLIPLHQIDLRRPAPRHLLLCYRVRPQPRRIDMAMSDSPHLRLLRALAIGVDLVAFSGPASAEDVFDFLAGSGDCGGVAGAEDVHDGIGGDEGFVLERGVTWQSIDELTLKVSLAPTIVIIFAR
jgi:hypothetical protein